MSTTAPQDNLSASTAAPDATPASSTSTGTGELDVTWRARESRGQRFRAALQGWARDTFSRDQIVSGVRSLLWVAPLTILIWVYAEREQQAKKESIPLPVAVFSADPTRTVRLLQPADGNVVVTLQGPRGALDGIQDKFNPLAGKAPVQIPIDFTISNGQQKIRANRIGLDGRLADVGITVVSAQPEDLLVVVDPIADLEARVVAPASLQFITPPTFSPPTVRVRGPASYLERAAAARPDGRLIVEAALQGRLAPNAASSEAPIILENVALSVPDMDPKTVTIVPAQVKATVAPAKPLEYKIVAPIRVVPKDPPMAIINEYRIEGDRSITDVWVVGPSDAIQKLEQNQFPDLLARFKIPPEAGPNVEQTSELEFVLPEGVKVVEQRRPPPYRFTLRPKSEG